jgi:hypothetical protein
MSSRPSLIDWAGFDWQAVNQGLAAWCDTDHRAQGLANDRANRVHMGSRNPLYLTVFRASSRVQIFPSERDLL